MDNLQIAKIFNEIGDIFDIQGENRFRVIAYHKAAQNIENLPRDLKDLYDGTPDQILELPGIGKDLAVKIIELITTGKCQYYEDLLKKFDKGLLDMLRVRGVGPKKVKLFYANLQINNIEKLRDAAQKGLLKDLPGMGPKSEAEILKALEDYDKHTERMNVAVALKEAQTLIEYMKKLSLVERIEYAGSLRRMKETIGDIDLLVAAKNPADVQKIMDFFVGYERVKNILGKGETKSSILLDSGIQVDLRVIENKTFGAALHYFTGSKAHNIMVRDRAKKMGLKVSEYGVFEIGKNGEEKLIGGKTEEELFAKLGLPYIIPEMREDRGEIEFGLKGELPNPLSMQDLRGDLHTHSRWSDGTQEIEVIAKAYFEAGFDYFALTDHSPSLVVAHGLTPERFELQWSEIDAINADYKKMAAKKGGRPFQILKGTECDIKLDGTMDLPDEILAQMDIVIASVHSRFTLKPEEQTERILKALGNPHVKILGHPSGRLINEREPIQFDVEKVIYACIKNRVALEINSQPSRLDLFDYYCKMARDKGAKFTIDSDMHNTLQMSVLPFGIAVARRGWIEAKDVLNTMPLQKLLEYFR